MRQHNALETVTNAYYNLRNWYDSLLSSYDTLKERHTRLHEAYTKVDSKYSELDKRHDRLKENHKRIRKEFYDYRQAHPWTPDEAIENYKNHISMPVQTTGYSQPITINGNSTGTVTTTNTPYTLTTTTPGETRFFIVGTPGPMEASNARLKEMFLNPKEDGKLYSRFSDENWGDQYGA